MADSPGFEEEVLSRIEAQLDPMSEAAAVLMGMPPGGKTYTKQDQLALWNSSPYATPQARVEAMLTMKDQGMSDEDITNRVYPERFGLIKMSRPKVQDQIRFAADMRKQMEQEAAKAGMPPLPETGQSFGTAVTQMPSGVATPMTDPMAPSPVAPMPQPAPMAAPAAPPSMLDQPVGSLLGG